MDPKETKGHKVYLALKVLRELKEDRDHLDLEANLVKRGKLVFLDFLDQQEEMACLVFVVYLEFLDRKVILEKMGPRVKWDHQALRVTKVARGI